MDKWQAQQNYWSSFGLTAYDENTVPEDAAYPYITYQAVSGSLDGQMTVSANLWYRGHSWTEISQKVNQMESMINQEVAMDGRQYMVVRKPESSFAQRLREDSDPLVRRILLTVYIEFLAN